MSQIRIYPLHFKNIIHANGFVEKIQIPKMFFNHLNKETHRYISDWRILMKRQF